MKQTTKYDYPEGLDSKGKKRFRAKMRRLNANGEKPKETKKRTPKRQRKNKEVEIEKKLGKREGNELIAIHKTVLKNYLNTSTKMQPLEIHKLMVKYDTIIDYTNIQNYYFHKMVVFTAALKKGNLSSIQQYIN